ncbi:MAG: hypothetical protein C4538_00360 [Nitrospiraceae bacterium]|nr:MAG: hypothetical protein C4538_00360 [Nitrospiraceae bacterium]
MSTGRVFILSFVMVFSACTNSPEQNKEAVFRQIPEIQEVKPEKPVKIKLKRTAKNDYSWEISGDDAEEVLKADRRLKQGLKTEQGFD